MLAPAHIETKMWKTWIEAHPELALASAERFSREANTYGMIKKMHVTDGYVYLVADHNEAGLDSYYA